MTSLRGQASWAKMTSSGGKQQHWCDTQPKEYNKAEEQPISLQLLAQILLGN